MQRFLAVVILGGALAATASAAFADDSLHGFPQTTSVQSAAPSQGLSAAVAGDKPQTVTVTDYQNR
jgi:hypothetical protein